MVDNRYAPVFPTSAYNKQQQNKKTKTLSLNDLGLVSNAKGVLTVDNPEAFISELGLSDAYADNLMDVGIDFKDYDEFENFISTAVKSGNTRKPDDFYKNIFSEDAKLKKDYGVQKASIGRTEEQQKVADKVFGIKEKPKTEILKASAKSLDNPEGGSAAAAKSAAATTQRVFGEDDQLTKLEQSEAIRRTQNEITAQKKQDRMDASRAHQENVLAEMWEKYSPTGRADGRRWSELPENEKREMRKRYVEFYGPKKEAVESNIIVPEQGESGGFIPARFTSETDMINAGVTGEVFDPTYGIAPGYNTANAGTQPLAPVNREPSVFDQLANQPKYRDLQPLVDGTVVPSKPGLPADMALNSGKNVDIANSLRTSPGLPLDMELNSGKNVGTENSLKSAPGIPSDMEMETSKEVGYMPAQTREEARAEWDGRVAAKIQESDLEKNRAAVRAERASRQAELLKPSRKILPPYNFEEPTPFDTSLRDEARAEWDGRIVDRRNQYQKARAENPVRKQWDRREAELNKPVNPFDLYGEPAAPAPAPAPAPEQANPESKDTDFDRLMPVYGTENGRPKLIGYRNYGAAKANRGKAYNPFQYHRNGDRTFSPSEIQKHGGIRGAYLDNQLFETRQNHLSSQAQERGLNRYIPDGPTETPLADQGMKAYQSLPQNKKIEELNRFRKKRGMDALDDGGIEPLIDRASGRLNRAQSLLDQLG